MKLDPARSQPDYYPLHVDILTRYSDLDPQEHVNNVAVADFYQEIRVQFHYEMPEDARPAGSRALIAHHAMDYLAEINYPGRVVVGLRVVQIGRTSYTLHLGLFQVGRCVGAATSVMVHGEGPGAAPIPAAMRAYLERFGGAAGQIPR